MLEYTADQLSLDPESFEDGSKDMELGRFLLNALPILQAKQPEIRFFAPKGGKIRDYTISASINGEEVGEIFVRYTNIKHPYEMYYVRGPFVKSPRFRNCDEIGRRNPNELFDLCVEKKFLRLKTTQETYVEAMDDFIWNYISTQLEKDEKEAWYFMRQTRDQEGMLRFLINLRPDRSIMNYLADLPKLSNKIKQLEDEIQIESAKLVAELDVNPKNFDALKHSPSLRKIMAIYRESH